MTAMGTCTTRATDTPLPHTTSSEKVVRPVQYLGSKLRSLDAIVSTVKDLIPEDERVLDLFSGTTVVGQGLADQGFGVVSTDAMRYSHSFAHALLNIDRITSFRSPDCLLALVTGEAQAVSSTWESQFAKYIEKEHLALTTNSGEALYQASNAVPQAWRAGQLPMATATNLCRRVADAAGKPAFEVGPIALTHYAGTYFGIRQASDIDSIRIAIENLKNSHLISSWEYHAALTALLSAASHAAFTPGKHFAQYHKIIESKDTSFHLKRLLSDRKIDIAAKMRKTLHLLWNRDLSKNTNVAVCATMESLLGNTDLIPSVGLIYADPPYTAQQYSRFYHVLEVITHYMTPTLQKAGDSYTAGLYPENRFKSRFSSKKKAPEAFSDLANLALSCNSKLVISYSGTTSGKTGNARMIDLNTLKSMLSNRFRKVTEIPMTHAYRQFNSLTSAVPERSDSELLIVCSQ